MYKILNKGRLNSEVMFLEIEAPLIAKAYKPGQFLLVMADEKSQRLALPICGSDTQKGSVSVVFNSTCPNHKALTALETGSELYAVLGPLGNPCPLPAEGRLLLVADGKGIAAMLPIARTAKQKGLALTILLGGKQRDDIYFVEEMMPLTDKLLLSSDSDNTYVQDMADTVAKQSGVAHCVVIGSLPVMKAVSNQAKALGIPTQVQLLASTFDGSGMSGDGRVSQDGKVLSASIEGPFFDGHTVDFDEVARQRHAPDASRYQAAETAPASARQLTDVVIPQEPLQRVQPQRQTPECRVRNFDEVSQGFTPEQAIAEAKRCLNCKNPRCSMKGCPIHNRIPEFIHQIVEGNFEEAYQIISTRSTLPAICGRVCPHEQQCEGSCIRGMKSEPLAIGTLERFVADWHREHVQEPALPAPDADAKRVAVVGGGPAGLACAHDLAVAGYRVTLFEAMHEVGGVLIYGIPEFVLPKKVVRHEVEKLRRMGVQIETNTLVGRTVTIDDLMDQQGYDAVFIGTGAGLPRFMGIKGETLGGIMSANELLAKVTMMHANEPDYDTPIYMGKRVAVIGGGNVAIDAARVALRLGADVTIVYRRDEESMPARRDEIQLAKEENIQLCTQTNPVEFLGDDNGNVSVMRCVRMQMGEPDSDGRRSFSPIEGSEFEMPIDNVIMALGSSAIPMLKQSTPDLDTDRKGLIVADDEGRTNRKGVFAGGDIVSGPATVVLAMGAGRRAAAAIDQYLRGE